MGGCDAEYTSVWKTWLSTATEMPSDASGKLCTKDLKKSQHSSGNDGNIDALDRAGGGARPKPLPNVLPKFLSSKCHPVHAKRTERGRRIEEPRQNLDVGCIICGIHGMGGTSPIFGELNEKRFEERKIDVPRPRCRWTSAVASKDCPVRSIQPQPASLVHPFSPPGHQRFDGGLEEIGVWTPAAAAAAASACSRSRTVSDESRMGWKWERYVIQTRDVKSA